jgi:hypothetical protein
VAGPVTVRELVKAERSGRGEGAGGQGSMSFSGGARVPRGTEVSVRVVESERVCCVRTSDIETQRKQGLRDSDIA